ncbi:MAG: hypothetical protein HRT55_16010 [Colwellia sp.]|nr:hypothetical protein [Colwellia sp.]NRA80316.1 hypothetical protein [Pseudoalteromonas sp.]
MGLDITSPFDVTRMPPVLIQRKVIEVSVLSAPSWYRQPKVLRLVS